MSSIPKVKVIDLSFVQMPLFTADHPEAIFSFNHFRVKVPEDRIKVDIGQIPAV